MKRFLLTIFSLAILFPVSVSTVGPTVIELKNPIQIKDKSGQVDAAKSKDIRAIVGNVIKNALAIIGSITLMVFVAGGFMWLTSAGNADKVKQGSETMIWAVVGLAVIFGSYAILSLLLSGLSGGGGSGSGPLPGQQATYYTLKKTTEVVYIKKEPKEDAASPSAFPIGAAVDCIAGTGKIEGEWVEVTNAGEQKATGWVNGKFLAKSSSNCGGVPAVEKKTKCETTAPYNITHACQDVGKLTAEQKKEKQCVSNLCENAILKAQGKQNPNDWMCCVK